MNPQLAQQRTPEVSVPPVESGAAADFPEKVLKQIAAEVASNSGDRSIDSKMLKLHLDQPYSRALLEHLIPHDPITVLSCAHFLEHKGNKDVSGIIEQAAKALDPIARIYEFEKYQSLPNAEAIREEAVRSLLKNDRGTVLRMPDLIASVDDFAGTYLDCYRQATPLERVGILSPASDFVVVECLPEKDNGAGESKENPQHAEGSAETPQMRKIEYPLLVVQSEPMQMDLVPEFAVAKKAETQAVVSTSTNSLQITDAMLQDAVATALKHDPEQIRFNPDWLGKQPWFNAMTHDFQGIAEEASPHAAVHSLDLLTRAGVAVPPAAMCRAIDRLIEVAPEQGIWSLNDAPLELDDTRMLAKSGIEKLLAKHPVRAFSVIESVPEKFVTLAEKGQYLGEAASVAYKKTPGEYLLHANEYPLPTFTRDISLLNTAYRLLQSDPGALLENSRALETLEFTSIAESILIEAVGAASVQDPEAALAFRLNNRSENYINRMAGVFETALKPVAEVAPQLVFENLDLVSNDAAGLQLLCTAASKFGQTELLRYTGLREIHSPPTEQEKAHIHNKYEALMHWAGDQPSPKFDWLFNDPAVVRALQVQASWIDRPTMTTPELNDLSLAVGRNIYAQEKPITAESVREEVEHIEQVREKYGSVELFKGRTVLFAANNELRNENSRFATAPLVETMRTAADGNLEMFLAPPNALTAEDEKKLLLERIRTTPGPITVYFNGHGHGNYGVSSPVFSFTETTLVSSEEIAAAFIERSRQRASGNQLSPEQRDIVIFDCCFSFNVVQKFYEELEASQKEGLPIAIGSAELGQYGYSNFSSPFGGNFSEDVLGLGAFKSQKDSGAENIAAPTIGDVIKNQGKNAISNSFIFAPNERLPYLQIALESLRLPAAIQAG